MGARFRYSCAACGYEAAVSGGYDLGFAGQFVTAVCLDCKELFDALIVDSQERRLPLACATRLAEPTHRVEIWGEREACPKCAEPMACTGFLHRWD